MDPADDRVGSWGRTGVSTVASGSDVKVGRAGGCSSCSETFVREKNGFPAAVERRNWRWGFLVCSLVRSGFCRKTKNPKEGEWNRVRNQWKDAIR